jgi:hypothetical protein
MTALFGAGSSREADDRAAQELDHAPQLVAVVRYKSECDVEEVPGVSRMSYAQAVEELREIARVAPHRLREFDIVYIQDGQLGRFASWSLAS